MCVHVWLCMCECMYMCVYACICLYLYVFMSVFVCGGCVCLRVCWSACACEWGLLYYISFFLSHTPSFFGSIPSSLSLVFLHLILLIPFVFFLSSILSMSSVLPLFIRLNFLLIPWRQPEHQTHRSMPHVTTCFGCRAVLPLLDICLPANNTASWSSARVSCLVILCLLPVIYCLFIYNCFFHIHYMTCLTCACCYRALVNLGECHSVLSCLHPLLLQLNLTSFIVHFLSI